MMHMIQAIDISADILYDNAKAQRQFQEMSNACLSHEMRNPLNAISGNVEIAKDFLL